MSRKRVITEGKVEKVDNRKLNQGRPKLFKEKTVLYVKMDRSLQRQLDAEAVIEKRPKSEIVREILVKHFKKVRNNVKSEN